MRHDKIVPGAILITLGVVFLLQSFGLFHIHWMNILHLWPIFLLIGGINLIFANNRSVWAAALKIGVVIIGLGILLFGNFNNDRFNFWPGVYYHSDNNNNDDDDDDDHGVVKVEGNSTFSEPNHAEARVAKLTITGGGTSYSLNDTTSQLFQAYTKEFGASYDFARHMEDSVAVLQFNMKKNSHFRWYKGKNNSVIFKLNSNPIWDIDVQAGAIALNFDLTKFKLRNFKINGGASSFDVKLGEPLEATNVNVSTGVADVNVSVPKDAACRIVTDSGLSSNNFDGFNKTSDNNYETPGFAAAKNKIYIKLDGAVSSFNVKRY